MILYVMRHGEAVPADRFGGPDHNRPLSPAGEKELAAAADEWARLKFAPTTLLSSPLKRAIQTAAYFARLASLQVNTVPALAAGVKPAAMRSEFSDEKWASPLLYVGHMPDLAVFSSRLTDQIRFLEDTVKPGEMLAFETGEWKNKWGTGRLLWRRELGAWKKVRELA